MSAGRPPLLEASGLVVQREGRTVLSVAHLAVAAGETLAIIGPNGAGKSTLLQALGLLQPLTAGDILLDGRPVRGRAATLSARRRMAMTFQEPLLFDTSVADNVASGLALRGLPRAVIAQRVDHWLTALGIAHLVRRPARALSGGEAQRVSLARSLALDPDLLLLDEPFAALDPATRAALLDDVERVLRRPGRSIVVVTHDRIEALRLADRVAVVLAGEIAQIGPPAAVFGHPATAAVAAFVGIEAILSGVVQAADAGLLTVAVGAQRLAVPGDLPLGRRVHVCIRPEDVAVTRVPAAGPTSIRNQLAGSVVRLVPQGALVRVDIDCDIDGGPPLIALVTRSSVDDLSLAPGSLVIAAIKASAIHLIACHEP